jgi:hypothetical protein
MGKPSLILYILLISFIAFFSGCKTSDETTPPVTIHKPDINSFSSDQTEVFAGETVILSWSVSNAESCSIDNGVGGVAASGSFTVYPQITTTFTLTATNSAGSSTRQIKVTIRVLLLAWEKKVESYGSPYVYGTIKNVSDKSIYNVMITFSAYNNVNTIIDTAHGFPADLGTIPPEVLATFEATFFHVNSWAEIFKLTYVIEWLNSAGVKESFSETVKL